MEKLRPSIENNGQIYSKEMALKYLSVYIGKTVAHFLDIIETMYFHIGDKYIDKAFYLGHVINKLISITWFGITY